MNLKRRIESLESRVAPLKEFVLVFVNEGDDEELAIRQELEERDLRRGDCHIMVVRFVSPKPRDS